MADGRIDEDGRLVLPPEVLERLGWKPGQELLLQVDGDMLLLQPGTESAGIKQQARRFVASLGHLTLEAGRAVHETVADLTATADKTASKNVQGFTGPFHGISPRVPGTAYMAPGSTALGDVSLGEDVSVWPGAILRGDVARVRVGARTNIQEGAVLHVSPQLPCTIGNGVTIGHQATVHGCSIEDYSLIGIHAVVLDGAVVGRHCIIAAGAVVAPGTQIPDGKMVMGVPGKIIRDLTPQEIERLHWQADSYVNLKNQYLDPSIVAETPPPPGRGAKPAPPQQGTLPRYECRRASGPIAIDGSLDDAGWSAAAPMSGLVHSNGSGEPTQHTEVRACWDDRCLYVSFACKDRDIWGNYEHRDDPLYDEEVVELFLCPTGDLRHYFEFEISPCNVIFDARVFNPELDRRVMLVDKEWNAPGLQTAVRVSGTLNDRESPDIGWIVEAAIPFADLGLEGPPPPGTVWRANFYRIERGEATEFTAWSPTYRDPADFHVPAAFGELVFIE